MTVARASASRRLRPEPALGWPCSARGSDWWPGWCSAGCSSSRARSRSATRPPASAPSPPTTCCRCPWPRSSATGCPGSRSAVGLLLVIGLLTRVSAVVLGLLLVAFIVGVGSAWARGLSIDCGCFGGGGQVSARQDRLPGRDPARRRPARARRLAHRAAGRPGGPSTPTTEERHDPSTPGRAHAGPHRPRGGPRGGRRAARADESAPPSPRAHHCAVTAIVVVLLVVAAGTVFAVLRSRWTPTRRAQRP